MSTTVDETIVLEESELERAQGRLVDGARVGRYQVLELVGEGGMGAVYAAYDPELDRRVALKVLHQAVSRDSASRGRQRLAREAQAMARLSHPNVITVHDVGTFEGAVFVAMEFVEGRTLGRWRDEEKPSLDALVDVFERAGRGVVAAHDAGLIHRDFKPQNVMVAHDGRVRVLDFGLARPGGEEAEDASGSFSGSFAVSSTGHLSSSGLDEALTADGQVMGTPAYMAPEQHRGRPVDPRCDQFSFCVAFYEAAYGERPFGGGSASSLRKAVLTGDVRDPPPGSEVPDAVRTVLLRGLAVSPDDRYPAMRDLLEALRQAVTPTKRNPVRFAAAAAIGLSIAGGLWSLRGGAAAPSHDPCSVDDDELAGVWDDEARQRLEQRFAASGLSSATRMATRVTSRLDAHAEAWRSGRYDACAATRVAKSQSDELMDLRMMCLEAARSKMATFVELLESADAATVERGEDVVKALGSLSTCADAEMLRADPRPPQDPDTAERVRAIRGDLDAVEAHVAAGRYPEAFDLAKAAVERARTTQHTPVLADALVWWGELKARRGDNPGSIATYHEAYYLAREIGSERTELSIALDLTFVYAQLQPDLSAATHWAHLARVLATRLDSPFQLANAYRYEGVAFAINSKFEEAAGRYEDARRVLDDRADPSLEKTAMFHAFLDQDLFRVQLRLGDEAAGRATSRRALAALEDLRGRDHPTTVQLAAELAYIDVESGNADDAIAAIEESIRVVAEVHGDNHPRALIAGGQLADVLWTAGKHEDAKALRRDLIERSETHLGPMHRSVAERSEQLARWLRSEERYDEALELYAKAIAVFEASGGPDDVDAADARLARVRMLLEAERLADARSMATADVVKLSAGDALLNARAEFYAIVADAAAEGRSPARLERARALHAQWLAARPEHADTKAMSEWLTQPQ
jgi:tetratricopeptide (TPR) repeat protein/predicted Ser/Thr protein kinase